VIKTYDSNGTFIMETRQGKAFGPDHRPFTGAFERGLNHPQGIAKIEEEYRDGERVGSHTWESNGNHHFTEYFNGYPRKTTSWDSRGMTTQEHTPPTNSNPNSSNADLENLEKMFNLVIPYSKILLEYIGLAVGPCAPKILTALRLTTALEIKKITPKSPAEEAGMKVGDVLLKVEGEPITTVDLLMKILNNYATGSRLKLILWRAGVRLTVTLTLPPTPRH